MYPLHQNLSGIVISLDLKRIQWINNISQEDIIVWFSVSISQMMFLMHYDGVYR